MKNLTKLNTVFALVLLTFFSVTSSAQKKSPAKTADGSIDGVQVAIAYSAPSVRERTIWGDLVPYNKVWRTGANKCTTITFDKDVKIEGKKLKAGTYGLFTIPSENEWTVIFNNNSKQWGAFKYKEAEDALRVKVKPQANSNHAEAMNINVSSKSVDLSWEKLKVSFKVKKG